MFFEARQCDGKETGAGLVDTGWQIDLVREIWGAFARVTGRPGRCSFDSGCENGNTHAILEELLTRWEEMGYRLETFGGLAL